MEIGKLKQKASSPLSIFVVMCMVIITGLLYMLQSFTATAQNISSKDRLAEYLN